MPTTRHAKWIIGGLINCYTHNENKMKQSDYIEKILNDFVFGDCRLGSHPRLRASVSWINNGLLCFECSTQPSDPSLLRKIEEDVLINEIIKDKKYLYINNIGRDPYWDIRPSGSNIIKSFICLPLIIDNDVVGVLSIGSNDADYFKDKHIGVAQLLATILIYSKFGVQRRTNSASIALGEALKRIRNGMNLSQDDLAELMKKSRIALSRWESGSQLPTIGSLYEWGYQLGLFSQNNGSYVSVVDISSNIVKLLKEDPTIINRFSPEQFENFIANRLDRMGFDVTLTGATIQKDGGIDLIAIPKIRNVGSFLLAGQIKHHQGNRKTGREAVDRLLSWKESYFRLGMLITNTCFTKDARWVASQIINKNFLRLRDFSDLKRWIEDDYWSENDWCEIPESIQLAPGIMISIPKPEVSNYKEIWPMKELDIKKFNG